MNLDSRDSLLNSLNHPSPNGHIPGITVIVYQIHRLSSLIFIFLQTALSPDRGLFDSSGQWIEARELR